MIFRPNKYKVQKMGHSEMRPDTAWHAFRKSSGERLTHWSVYC